MLLVIYILALLLSFYLMAKVVDDFFVDSLDKIARRLNMSSDAAGATLMAVGSSAPELFIAIIAVVRPGDHEQIGMGTIVGSAIFNVLVITGVVGIVKKSLIPWQGAIRDLLFYTLSIVLLIFAVWDGAINMYEAFAFILLYVIYVVTVIYWQRILKYESSADGFVEEDQEEEEPEKWWEIPLRPFNYVLKKMFPSPDKYYGVFGISIAIIAALSWVLVESAIYISHTLHIPEAIIALTVLAVGTSIPDLLSSIIVAKQGRGGMAVSNGIGSNIFDILIGLGVPFIIMLGIQGLEVNVATDNLSQSIVLLFASVVIILGLFLVNKWCIGKGMGGFLVFLYFAYVIWQLLILYGVDTMIFNMFA